jgi:hypothetical protein
VALVVLACLLDDLDPPPGPLARRDARAALALSRSEA